MKKIALNNLEWKDRFGYVKNVLFQEKDLKQQGALFQIVKFRPGDSIKPHHHKETVEIFYIQSGKGLLTMNDETFEVQPNDIILCEPGDIHSFKNDGPDDLVILVFKTNEKVDQDIHWDA